MYRDRSQSRGVGLDQEHLAGEWRRALVRAHESRGDADSAVAIGLAGVADRRLGARASAGSSDVRKTGIIVTKKGCPWGSGICYRLARVPCGDSPAPDGTRLVLSSHRADSMQCALQSPVASSRTTVTAGFLIACNESTTPARTIGGGASVIASGVTELSDEIRPQVSLLYTTPSPRD
jgi:hypothetical protein